MSTSCRFSSFKCPEIRERRHLWRGNRKSAYHVLAFNGIGQPADSKGNALHVSEIKLNTQITTADDILIYTFLFIFEKVTLDFACESFAFRGECCLKFYVNAWQTILMNCRLFSLLITNTANNISILFKLLFRANKARHLLRIVCLAKQMIHIKCRLIFLAKLIKSIFECCLLRVCLALWGSSRKHAYIILTPLKSTFI